MFCPSKVVDSFAGYSSLGWHPWYLNIFIMFDHDLLAFIVSTEKSGVILFSLPLHVTWPFSFVALNFISLFCIFNVLFIMWRGDFFFDPVYLVFCKLLVAS